MQVKARFVDVLGVRSFQSNREGAMGTRYSVTYMIELFSGNDTMRQRMLVERFFDAQPEVAIGPVCDNTVYDMTLWFSVNADKSNDSVPLDQRRFWQRITLTKVSVEC